MSKDFDKFNISTLNIVDKPVLLLDMDGVFVDTDGEIYRNADFAHKLIPHDDRTSLYFHEDHDDDTARLIRHYMTRPGFFRRLVPYENAVDVIHELDKHVHVVFCTSMLYSNPTCMQDKALCLEEHLGEEYKYRLIIAKDKTLVHGDWLVDDRPEIKGSIVPSWEHVVYDQPYNRLSSSKSRVMNWEDLFNFIRGKIL